MKQVRNAAGLISLSFFFFFVWLNVSAMISNSHFKKKKSFLTLEDAAFKLYLQQ